MTHSGGWTIYLEDAADTDHGRVYAVQLWFHGRLSRATAERLFHEARMNDG